MEDLLHYVWKHKIFPLTSLRTTDGRELEVIHPGLHNLRDAGPDFFNAKITIDGTLWAGNVEIHEKTSDWFHHGHQHDRAYDNIILHVVGKADMDLPRPSDMIQHPTDREETLVPQLELPIPGYVRDNYLSLLMKDRQVPRCSLILPGLSALTVHSWLSALQVERLEEKTRLIAQRVEELEKDWERALFVTLARNFGFGKNGDVFELWAKSIPLSAIGKHRDNLFQIEAIFLGQAGMLASSEAKDKEAETMLNAYRKEYSFLRHKFSLKPIAGHLWSFGGTRPPNFPTIRIMQLAMLYHLAQCNLSRLMEAESIDEVEKLMHTHVSGFWQHHYTFSGERNGKNTPKELSEKYLDILVINTIIPMLFAYGRHKHDEQLTDRALTLMQELKPENNSIITQWKAAGVDCMNAGDSQAILQLHQRYCMNSNCLRCRFGNEYIRRTPDMLREEK